MPDLVTHTTFAWLCGRPFLGGRRLLLLLAGAHLPDLVTRVPAIFLDQAAVRWLQPMHTPLGYALLCLLVAQAFRADLRRAACGLLLLGGATHLLADALQRNLTGSYHWLFPFSTWNGQVGWFGGEAFVPTVPAQLALLVLVEALLARRRRGVKSGAPDPAGR